MEGMSSSILETPEVERLATGFGFTEGPLWHPNGYLLFVDIYNDQLLRWSHGQATTMIRQDTNQGNGLTFDINGNLIMCEGGNRRLSRTEVDGTMTVLADNWQNKRLNRPNDVVCRSDGNIYFTDPEGRVPAEDRETNNSGVYKVSVDGNVSLSTTDCAYPNGLAFSPNEQILYVTNTRPDQYIRAFNIALDGSLTNSRVFADLSGTEEGVPDGIKVDIEGRVFCTGPGGTWVFDPEGHMLGKIQTPELPANFAFGDHDRRSLFITARTSVYKVRVTIPGTESPGAQHAR